MTADNGWAARAGRGIRPGRIAKNPEGLDLSALLDRIEAEMSDADPAARWTLNNTLAAIGINHPKLRSLGSRLAHRLARDTARGR
jgi:3-methyladenine DNA glycosylase AlkD